MPKVVDGRFRFAQLPGKIHELAAEIREEVAEPGGVAAGTWQALAACRLICRGIDMSPTGNGVKRGAASIHTLRLGQAEALAPAI
jgi:hypothetical protein